jgi:predicted hydrocarbon binding protein
MFNVLEKLLALRQVKFERGQIFLFGQPDLLIPARGFLKIQKELVKSGKENLIYESGKESGYDWFEGMSKNRKMKVTDVANWGSDLVTLSGWGIAELKKIKQSEKYMEFNLINSTIAKNYGKSNEPVCHMFRGLVAGAAEFTFKCKIDAVETKCIAKGDSICEFIIQPKQKFDKKNKIVKKQLN